MMPGAGSPSIHIRFDYITVDGKPDVDRWRPDKTCRPLRRRAVDLIRSQVTFLGDFVRPAGPAPVENVLRILQGSKDSDRLRLGCAVGLEVRRRSILEIRHILRRLAVQRIECHIQRVPRTCQFQARISRRVCIIRDWYLVVEPPTQLGVTAVKVVDQALNDFAKGTLPARYGVLKCVLPLRPCILFPDSSGGTEQFPAGCEGSRDLGT